MFRPFVGDIYGLHKLYALLGSYNKRVIVEIGGANQATITQGVLNVVSSVKLTFQGLHPHRDAIRKRLLGIVNDPVPSNHSWGHSGFVAVHVRLGDFVQASEGKVLSTQGDGIRIPLSWYENILKRLRKRYPDRPIEMFSDGTEKELQPLLQSGARLYQSGSDITDLLAMSSASLLVGSNSSYSRWAAFLGNMPSIWLKKDTIEEKPSDPYVPILYVPYDATELHLWHQDVLSAEAFVG